MYLLSVWLHLVAAIAWIGGMIFIATVLVPTIREPAFREHSAPLVGRVGVRFRAIAWILIAVLIVTGTISMNHAGIGWADVVNGQLLRGRFGRILAVKLAVVAVVVLMSVVHDFFIGPAATRAARSDPGSPAATRLRLQASWMGRINLLLSLLIVALAIVLARAHTL